MSPLTVRVEIDLEVEFLLQRSGGIICVRAPNQFETLDDRLGNTRTGKRRRLSKERIGKVNGRTFDSCHYNENNAPVACSLRSTCVRPYVFYG